MAEFYREPLQQLSSLPGKEPDPIANAAAILFEMMPNLNWRLQNVLEFNKLLTG
jgi:hypothetical protein